MENKAKCKPHKLSLLFIKAINPVKPWFTVNLEQLRGVLRHNVEQKVYSYSKLTVNHGFAELIKLLFHISVKVLYHEHTDTKM